MTSAPQSYGARFVSADPEQRAALHLAEGKRNELVGYDAALGRLLERAIRGEQVIDLRALKILQDEGHLVDSATTLSATAKGRLALNAVITSLLV